MPSHENYTNGKYSDRELLHVISACSVGGLASTEEIADALGVSDNGHSKMRAISPRLSWMKRYGFIRNVDPPEQGVGRDYKGKLWSITDLGESLMGGRLNKSVESSIERARPGDQLLMMRQLARRAFSSPQAATAVRREYAHQVAQRVA